MCSIEFLSNEVGLEYKEDLVFPDGTVYKGQVKEGLRHGFGIQVWPDGARYEGMW
jgi:MORN repeat